MATRLDKVFLRVVQACTALLLLLPLLGTNSVLFSAIFVKGLVLQLLIGIMLAAWIPLAVSNPRYRPNFKNPVVIAVSAFTIILAVTLPLALDPEFSFWSTRGRMTGVLSYIHFYTLFLVLISVYKTWKEWRILLIASTFVSLGVDLVAFVQIFFGSGTFGARLYSTLGNPVHLASYLLLVFFITAFLLLKEQSKHWRMFFIGALIINGISLFLTLGRGAILGLIAGMGFLAFSYFLSSASGKKRWLGPIIFVAIFTLMFTGYFGLRQFADRSWAREYLPAAVTDIVYRDLGSSRLRMWSIGWQGIRERPVFGWGIEGYAAVFNKYFDPAGADAKVPDIWNDRPHNIFVDFAVSNGFIGLVFYLALWIVVFVMLFRLLRRTDPKKRLPILVLISLFIAHNVQNFFSFDMPASNLLVYTLFALVAVMCCKTEEDKAEKTKQMSPAAIALTAIIPLCLILAGEYRASIKPFQQAQLNKVAYETMKSDRKAAIELYRESMAMDTFVTPEFRKEMMDSIIYVTNFFDTQTDSVKGTIDFAVSEMDKQAADRPYDLWAQLDASYANRLSAMYTGGDINAALEYAKKADALTNNRYEEYLEFAEIEMFRENYEEALAWFEKMPEGAFRAEYKALVPFRKACVLARLHEYENSFEQYEIAKKYQYNVKTDIRLALALAEEIQPDDPEFEKALEVIEEMIANYPTNHPDLRKIRALTLYKSGDIDTAKIFLEALKERNVELYDETADLLDL